MENETPEFAGEGLRADDQGTGSGSSDPYLYVILIAAILLALSFGLVASRKTIWPPAEQAYVAVGTTIACNGNIVAVKTSDGVYFTIEFRPGAIAIPQNSYGELHYHGSAKQHYWLDYYKELRPANQLPVPPEPPTPTFQNNEWKCPTGYIYTLEITGLGAQGPFVDGATLKIKGSSLYTGTCHALAKK